MKELTVKEFAAREQVTERTVYNWMAKGAVDARRTPGGRIRIKDRREESQRGMKYSENSGNTAI